MEGGWNGLGIVSSGGSFCISSVEHSRSANRELISTTDIREIHCEDGRWMELAQGCVQCQALVLVAAE
jgi:hypothetical protein